MVPLLGASVSDFFTFDSLKTFQGAIIATFVVGAGVGALLSNTRSRAVAAFLFAMLLQLFVAYKASGPDSGEKWIVAVANGFLVFTSALGINEFLAARFGPDPPAVGLDSGGSTGWRSWLRD